MKHLVTGGSGFLGNLIARKLLERNEKVKILDIRDDPNRPKEIEFIQSDIRDASTVAEAMKGIDIVHHNVALVPLTKSGKKFIEVNVNGSKIAAEQAVVAGVKAFIHMSSSAVYGASDEYAITATTPLRPVEIYGKAKLAGELIVRKVCENANLPLIVIRPRTILGEGRLGIFQILFEWIRENKNVYTIGDGNGLFQFVHAHDLMDAYMLALDKQKPNIYNVGAAEFGTLRQAIENVIKYANSSSKVKSLPISLTIGTLKALDWLGLSPLAPWHYLTYHRPFHFDVNPLLGLGWQPKYSNDKMLQESYDWFISNYSENNANNYTSVHRSPVNQRILKLVKKLS